MVSGDRVVQMPIRELTTSDLLAVEAQERSLACADGLRFGAEEALDLGCIVARLSLEYDRGVSLRIVRESDCHTLLEWACDDKGPRNQLFLEGKRQATLACGHSSLWSYVAHEVDGRHPELRERQDHPERASHCVGEASEESFVCMAGGCVPVVAGDRCLATVCVSGLHEGKDHELVVRALCEAFGLRYGFDVPALGFQAV